MCWRINSSYKRRGTQVRMRRRPAGRPALATSPAGRQSHNLAVRALEEPTFSS